MEGGEPYDIVSFDSVGGAHVDAGRYAGPRVEPTSVGRGSDWVLILDDA